MVERVQAFDVQSGKLRHTGGTHRDSAGMGQHQTDSDSFLFVRGPGGLLRTRRAGPESRCENLCRDLLLRARLLFQPDSRRSLADLANLELGAAASGFS